MARTGLAGRRQTSGKTTRGKTARNRLRRVDTFLALYDPGLIRRSDGEYQDAIFLDLGYGAEPLTTLESAARLRRLNPTLPVVGVEIDPERVATAQRYADEMTHFRQGGFNLPLEAGERVRIIRAFNVLREYEESAVEAAHATLGDFLLPGGLLIEGTSDPLGRLWVANLIRKAGVGDSVVEGLLFSTNFRWGFNPEQFQPVLPKNYIHRMVPGEPIHGFLTAWKRCYLAALPLRVWGPRQLFVAAARELADRGYSIDRRQSLLTKGYMLWRPLRRYANKTVRDGILG
jgi:hypothetical protein